MFGFIEVEKLKLNLQAECQQVARDAAEDVSFSYGAGRILIFNDVSLEAAKHTGNK